MRRWLTGLAAAVAMLGLATGGALAQGALERAKLVVGLPHNTSTFLPLYLAEEEGFFKREGLEVELVAFRGGTDLVRGMVAGAVQVGVGAFSEVTVGIEAGQNLKVFYGGFNMAVFDWYAVPRIKSFKDARGARFGVTTFGSSTDFLTRYAIKQNGLNPQRDVQIIQGGGSVPRLAAMEAGQLDVNIFATPEKFLAADKGYNLILRQTDLAEEFPFHVFYAPERFIQQNPNALKALLRGFVHGVRLAKADKARSVKTIVTRLGFEEGHAARGYDDFIGHIHEDGRMPPPASMKTFWDIGIDSGTYTEAWPQSRWWFPGFHETYAQWKPQ
jgi:NitT/TauT family transport system substrate-binding protein